VPAGFLRNSGFQVSLLPYDLSRGGTEFQFRGVATIYEESAFAQDTIKAGRWTFSPRLRFDRYDGLSHAYGVQPRVAIAYQVPFTGKLLRLSYARIFLTPYNENLVLSSATGLVVWRTGRSARRALIRCSRRDEINSTPESNNHSAKDSA